MRQSLVCEHLHIVVKMLAKTLLGRVLMACLARVDKANSIAKRVHDALSIESVEKITGDLVIARREIDQF